MLPEGADESLNFLDRNIAEYAQRRAVQIKNEGGTIDRDRLMRNMLSSMPLCFNLFGYLREHYGEAAHGLGKLLDLDIDDIFGIEVEWAPDRDAHLRDRTAFDAFVRYRTTDGRRAFLGVETKYTEPFSSTPYVSEHYDRLTRDMDSGFKAGAEKRLCKPATNQLWRNALLVHSLRLTRDFCDGHVVVLSCEGDAGARRAITGLESELRQPSSLLRTTTYEKVVTEFATIPATRMWASEFRRRYLMPALPPNKAVAKRVDGIAAAPA